MASRMLSGRAGALACLLAAALLLWGPASPSASAQERGLPALDSQAWCGAHAKASEGPAQCLRAEAACRAVLPDMAPAGGCPDRQLDRCLARLGEANSWCAVLCCLDADDPACRAAKQATPELLPLLRRAAPLP